MQWVDVQVEVVAMNDSACVALANSQEELQEGEVKCLRGRVLSEYYYISAGPNRFVPVNVKPMSMFG
jgi:hypothetical protein